LFAIAQGHEARESKQKRLARCHAKIMKKAQIATYATQKNGRSRLSISKRNAGKTDKLPSANGTFASTLLSGCITQSEEEAFTKLVQK